MLLLIVATSATVVLAGLTYYNGRTILPITVSIFGLLDLYLIFAWGIGYAGIAVMGVLGIVLAITYKLDVS